ncbi:hypothetical protein X801_05634 [Opisthorchis viverrini]|uniref:Reverse transcriptase RNase H-like domain-containing protein n=1 Tax=Opisthorchis viverrini TaxID=6198 RepID=A0A1S8WVN8_OPIVI|nr:hypothetical protein X801_05634 [Opisthorchis viverrini]
MPAHHQNIIHCLRSKASTHKSLRANIPSEPDQAHAYEQLELAEEAKPVTTISTHRVLFVLIAFLLESVPLHLYFNAHLKECELRVKKEKCYFLVDHVDYLGFRVSAEGLAPLVKKTRSILEAPQPRNKHELRSFLGMVNHCAMFIPQAATRFHPPSFLTFDAGVGAVLSQKDKPGILKAVTYASPSFSPAERSYAQIDKEALAILSGHYLFGQTFGFFTDHKPPLVILGEDKLIPQMTLPGRRRWALKLACYRYHLR